MNNKTKNLIIIILVLGFICLSFFFGYGMGFRDGIRMTIKFGLEFVDIEVDGEMLSTAIYQYQNNIGGCLFNQNASIRN